MAELPISLLPALFPALLLGPFLALLMREDLILVSVLYLEEKGHSDPPQCLSLLPAPRLCWEHFGPAAWIPGDPALPAAPDGALCPACPSRSLCSQGITG